MKTFIPEAVFSALATGALLLPETLPNGAHPYKQDLKDIKIHLLDTGHLAPEEFGDEISSMMIGFLDRFPN